MSDSLQFWNLVVRPFEAPWDARFFFRGTQHLEALDRLIYLAQEGSMNFGMLTGEIGCGKTMVRAVLQQQLAGGSHRIVTFENSCFSLDELALAILRRLSPPDAELPTGRLDRLEMLQQMLQAMADEGRQVLLLLDETQELNAQALNELRWLTNFNGGGRNVITIVLIGQPNLQALVDSIPAINQRISLRYHLRPLPAEEVPEYLAHRLHVAGHPTGQLFDADAASLLHRVSRGVPREINRLAKLALEHGWLTGAACLNAASVQAVFGDLQRQQAVIP